LALNVFRPKRIVSLSWFVVGAFVAPVVALLPQAAKPPDTQPRISDQPLTSDQLAIYREILHGWMDDQKHPVHLSIQTVPLEKDSDDCAKKVSLEKIDPLLIHRFRKEDVEQLGSKMIELVDPDVQRREVEKNDPGKAIRSGVTVDDAVNNGFAHGLVTLSEIRFDQKHELAIVWYGFRCGGLCGNGGTAVMEKKNGVWQNKSYCSMWVSRGSGFQTLAGLAAIKINSYGNRR